MKKTLKYGCIGTGGIFILFLISFPLIFKQAFGPLEEQVKIEQNIGGKLLCNSTYHADIHSWQYDIDFRYQDEKGNVYSIGKGTYFNREWDKNEQLVIFDNWLILKTGGFNGTDKIFIGSLDRKQWNHYEFSPEKIEQDSLWISENIHSIMNWLPQEAFVRKIDDGVIEVEYLYRTGETVKDHERRLVIYQINEETGELSMNKIQLIQ